MSGRPPPENLASQGRPPISEKELAEKLARLADDLGLKPADQRKLHGAHDDRMEIVRIAEAELREKDTLLKRLKRKILSTPAIR